MSAPTSRCRTRRRRCRRRRWRTRRRYAIGAANTLWLDQAGRLCASNTDAYGFMTNLNEQAPGWNASRRPVLVLGAGGAARAILHGLLEAGATRSPAGQPHARPRRGAGAGLRARLGRGGRLGRPRRRAVRLRPAGQRDQPRHDRQGAARHRPRRAAEDAVVADIVYSPLETPLLAAARARGRRTVDGLGMLLHQAVPGFERWFGVRPEVTPELRAHVAASLGAA